MVLPCPGGSRADMTTIRPMSIMLDSIRIICQVYRPTNQRGMIMNYLNAGATVGSIITAWIFIGYIHHRWVIWQSRRANVNRRLAGEQG